MALKGQWANPHDTKPYTDAILTLNEVHISFSDRAARFVTAAHANAEAKEAKRDMLPIGVALEVGPTGSPGGFDQVTGAPLPARLSFDELVTLLEPEFSALVSKLYQIQKQKLPALKEMSDVIEEGQVITVLPVKETA